MRKMTDSFLDAGDVIRRLGGTTKTAALCEVSKSAVSQWLKNGIPKAQLKYLKAVRPSAFEDTEPHRRRESDKCSELLRR